MESTAGKDQRKSTGIYLAVMFPIFTVVFVYAPIALSIVIGMINDDLSYYFSWMQVVSYLVAIIMVFSSPITLIIELIGLRGPPSPGMLRDVMFFMAFAAHIPIYGYAIGYLWPYQIKNKVIAMKKAFSRYLLFLSFSMFIGIPVALVGLVHDS